MSHGGVPADPPTADADAAQFLSAGPPSRVTGGRVTRRSARAGQWPAKRVGVLGRHGLHHGTRQERAGHARSPCFPLRGPVSADRNVPAFPDAPLELTREFTVFLPPVSIARRAGHSPTRVNSVRRHSRACSSRPQRDASTPGIALVLCTETRSRRPALWPWAPGRARALLSALVLCSSPCTRLGAPSSPTTCPVRPGRLPSLVSEGTREARARGTEGSRAVPARGALWTLWSPYTAVGVRSEKAGTSLAAGFSEASWPCPWVGACRQPRGRRLPRGGACRGLNGEESGGAYPEGTGEHPPFSEKQERGFVGSQRRALVLGRCQWERLRSPRSGGKLPIILVSSTEMEIPKGIMVWN